MNYSVVGSYKKLYITKKSDNTDVKVVKYSNGNEFRVSNSTNNYFSPVFTCNNILVFKTDDNNYNYAFYVLDLSTGIVKKTNALNMSESNNVDIGGKVVFARAFTYLNFRLVMNPFILTTKNNLDSPVTKTASQTMKITYILSEVKDSEVV